MNSSIINNTLSKQDAYLRHDLPRFEQSVKNTLAQIATSLKSISKYLENGSTLTVQGVKYELTAKEIEEFAPAQIAEVRAIEKALAEALASIGYTKTPTIPPAAIAGATVVESTSQTTGQTAKKSATIIPPIS